MSSMQQLIQYSKSSRMCHDDMYQSKFFFASSLQQTVFISFFWNSGIAIASFLNCQLCILTNVKYSFNKKIVHYYPKMKFFIILAFVTFAGSVQEHANSRCNMDFLRIAHDQAEECIRVDCVDHPVVILYIYLVYFRTYQLLLLCFIILHL